MTWQRVNYTKLFRETIVTINKQHRSLVLPITDIRWQRISLNQRKHRELSFKTSRSKFHRSARLSQTHFIISGPTARKTTELSDSPNNSLT